MPFFKKSKLNKNKCNNCGKEWIFTEYPSSKKSGHRGLFCSHECHIFYMKNNSFNFNCLICEKTVYTQPAQIKYRNRKTCSMECKAKYMRICAEIRRIVLGYTQHQLDRLDRYSREANEWRMSVFKRDNFTCQSCGIRGTYLEAHHVKPFAHFPHLRYELSNGRTLCKSCHNTTKISYKKMREIYETK